MQEKYYEKLDQKIYKEKLDNGLEVVIVPMNTNNKFVIWGANVGSVDNKFIAPGENDITVLPDGIAHYLEHKLFEQESGRNSLDTLTALGVDANAYTSNDHTAFLFGCTDNYEEALDEFMDYVQHPYFTEENIEKERGIIGQEIMMYDDEPEWAVYINAMKIMYHANEIRIDEAGTIETIKEIDKEKLYKLYNSFYTPDNMYMVLAGNFNPEEAILDVKKRMVMPKHEGELKRIYNEEPKEIVQKQIEKSMDISMPIVFIGYKDNDRSGNEIFKDIAVDMVGDIYFGLGSDFYREMYESGKIPSVPGVTYEFGKTYGHVMIQVKTPFPEEVISKIQETIEKAKAEEIPDEDFIRYKRKMYGEFIRAFDNPDAVATEILSDYFKNVDIFDYLDAFEKITKKDVENILKEVFNEEYRVVSIINTNE